LLDSEKSAGFRNRELLLEGFIFSKERLSNSDPSREILR
jgi:hypothetical protein